MKYVNNIRAIRKERGYSQADIAEILETTQQHYSCYENGKNELPIRHVIALCNFYGVTSDELLGIKNERVEENLKALNAIKYIEQQTFTSYADFLKKAYKDGMQKEIEKELGLLQTYWIICEKLNITPDPQKELELAED